MVLDSGITISLGNDLRFVLSTKSWGNFLKKIGVISKKKKKNLRYPGLKITETVLHRR